MKKNQYLEDVLGEELKRFDDEFESKNGKDELFGVPKSFTQTVDIEQEIKMCDKEIEINPNNLDAFVKRRNLNYAKGDLEQAIRDCNNIIRIDSRNAEAYVERGSLWQEKGDFEQAKKDYDRAISLNKNFAMAYVKRGNLFLNNGKKEDAQRDFDKAIELTPDDAEVYVIRGSLFYKNGELETALTNFNKAVELNPNHAEAYLKRGNLLFKEGNLEGAKKDYFRSLKINPNHAEAYNNLGLLFFEAGELNDAKEYLRKAIAIKPSFAEAYVNLGNVLFKKGESLAEDNYNKAIEINPKFAEAYYNRGVYYLNKGVFDKAISDSYCAIELSPSAKAHLLRGKLLYKSERFSLAKEEYKKALELDQTCAEAYFLLGNLFQEEGDVKTFMQNMVYEQKNPHYVAYCLAEEFYENAVNFNPSYTEAYVQLGNLLFKLKKEFDSTEEPESILLSLYRANINSLVVDAKSCFDKAIKLEPNIAEAYNGVGLFYLTENDLENAQASFERAIELNQEYAEAFYNLGNVFLETGNFGQAILEYSKAISLKKDFYAAFEGREKAYKRNFENENAEKDRISAFNMRVHEEKVLGKREEIFYDDSEKFDESKMITEYVRNLENGNITKAYTQFRMKALNLPNGVLREERAKKLFLFAAKIAREVLRQKASSEYLRNVLEADVHEIEGLAGIKR